MGRARTARERRRELGASAIEFAIVFPLFFGLIYIMVSYGLLFSLQHSITEAAKESARAAVACDPTRTTAEHEACVTSRARATAAAALDWLPTSLRDRILGASNGLVEVTFDTDATAGKTVEVLVQLPDYASAPHASDAFAAVPRRHPAAPRASRGSRRGSALIVRRRGP
jgi:Flp pilus assembly protein TadG